MVAIPPKELEVGGINVRKRWLRHLGLVESKLPVQKYCVVRWNHFPPEQWIHPKTGKLRFRLPKTCTRSDASDPSDRITGTNMQICAPTVVFKRDVGLKRARVTMTSEMRLARGETHRELDQATKKLKARPKEAAKEALNCRNSLESVMAELEEVKAAANAKIAALELQLEQQKEAVEDKEEEEASKKRLKEELQLRNKVIKSLEQKHRASKLTAKKLRRRSIGIEVRAKSRLANNIATDARKLSKANQELDKEKKTHVLEKYAEEMTAPEFEKMLSATSCRQ